MNVFSIIFGVPIGILALLFFIWKRLREDYTSERIFSLGFIVVLLTVGGIVLGLIANNLLLKSVFISKYRGIFLPAGLWFWLAFIFIFSGFGFFVKKFKLRFFEVAESVGVGLFTFLFAVSLFNGAWFWLIFLITLIFVFFFLERRYRSFSWYKSGKAGFSGLVVIIIFFAVRVPVALFSPNMLSFVGKFDAILDVISIFIFCILFIKLSDI